MPRFWSWRENSGWTQRSGETSFVYWWPVKTTWMHLKNYSGLFSFTLQSFYQQVKRSRCLVFKAEIKSSFSVPFLKDGPEGQAGERDCPCTHGLLSAGENLQCILRRAGREILLPWPTLSGTVADKCQYQMQASITTGNHSYTTCQRININILLNMLHMIIEDGWMIINWITMGTYNWLSFLVNMLSLPAI